MGNRFKFFIMIRSKFVPTTFPKFPMVKLDTDVFATILTYIHDPATIYTLFRVFPKSHPLFLTTVDRLWQLPVNLDSFDPRVTTASNHILDYLLTTPAEETEPHGYRLRQLVVRLEHESLESRDQPNPPASILALRGRIVDLLGVARNLRSLDYHGYPGLRLDSDILTPLAKLEWLEQFSTDCARCSSEQGVPASGGDYAAPGELSAKFDAENWDMDTTIGPSLFSLELRHINQTMFGIMKTKVDEFKTYTKLRRLALDITEGVWDWGGGGSPAMGATPTYEFPFLGFPSVRSLELVVCDKTLSALRTGPLNMVNCSLLTELYLDVRYSIWWLAFPDIRLFGALAPLEMSSLRVLEIKDGTKNSVRHHWSPSQDTNGWDHDGRQYHGLVSRFISNLPHLTTLWVDERVLLPAGISVQQLLANPQTTKIIKHAEAFQIVLSRLTSLRVGFGRVDAVDVQTILERCDATKLTQFGFEWKWQAYGQNETISTQLLDSIARFPLLRDVHILFPRPGTETNQLATTDPRTLTDVAALFACNNTIATVGIGHSVIWDRGSPPVLVCDGKHGLPNAAVSKFFQAGFMLNGQEGLVPDCDNCIPERPDLREEIEQLRDVLRDILT
ncbi:Glycosyltransferase family 32 protein [Mycena indigotica]|uniref:Glycosyltransferase family 32 protein n=1 Tax=Mycena indigotica TaxID=2126181 RepID=A0A8H6SJ75_9AGAR|nr:Glycosyltransferase family 32 protein [Mycena indigotica]KAF7299307.1 Glycosyltransferase family 32 protein [Mycena indigotica]